MRITKFGHACLFVEEGGARLLIDPGEWSQGYEDLHDLDAVLITHQHADHVVPEKLAALVAENPKAKVYADAGTAALLGPVGVTAQAMHAGDEFEVNGVTVAVIGTEHAEIHPDVPQIPNVGYLIAGRLFYPGDALTVPEQAVEVLAAPSVAPWTDIAHAVDFVRAVKPKVAIPVHDAIAAKPEIYADLIGRLTAGQGVTVRVVPNGTSIEV